MTDDRGSEVRTLRQNLFRSHLIVILVALVVVLFGAALIAAVFSVFDASNDARRGGPFVLLLPVGAAAGAAALVSWFVTRKVGASLNRVREAAVGLAGGNYAIRVGPSDIEELHDLGESMNVLAEALEQTEKRRLELLGDVAHELRNPLATIEALMEGLMDGVTAADDETYALVSQQAARLTRLARDLSDLSASSEWVSTERFASIHLNELVGEVAAQLTPQAAAKDLSIQVNTTESATVIGDRDRLAQVLVNVIGNAIQYSDSGHINVALEVAGTDARVTVGDSGRGLEQQDLARIFERFYRVDRTYNDGTGVGLAIAKAIVEGHGGTISAASQGAGQGTSVTIRIPLQTAQRL